MLILSSCIARSGHVNKLNEVVLNNAYAIQETNPTPSNAANIQEAARLLKEGSSIRLPIDQALPFTDMLGPFAGLAGAGLAMWQAKQKADARKREAYAASKARQWAKMDRSDSESELDKDNAIPS